MAKNEFDKEMCTYLTRRKKAEIPDILKWLKGLIPKPTPPPIQVNIPAEIETYEEKKIISKSESKQDVIEEYTPENKNVLDFILGKLRNFGFFKKSSISEEEQEATIKDIVAKEMIQKDLREVSKIALMAIKKLPEEDMKEFKESAEFDNLKKILKKHDLIK
ncbi:hypothetical protein JW851_04845 [Candidatus Woesearchaeota archaeon]|nr:hypothetical protein [Candidatus Woesearchaeota archaeon]